MKRFAVMAMVLTMLGTGVQGQDQARLLKAATNTEMVDGNLKLAIEQYKKVAEGSDRGLAAQALLRIAECYQMLGDAEAQMVYQRIVRDFSDQKDLVVVARARLGSAAATSIHQTRTLAWTHPDVKTHLSPVVSPDGRHVAYSDNYTVYLHDLAAVSARRLVIAGDARVHAKQLAFARDGTRLFYTWRDNRTESDELRAVDVSAAGVTEPRVLFRNDEIPVIMHPSASPDGKLIAANLVHRDRSVQIGLISTADGSFRVLKSIDWQGTGRLAFSPDSRYLGFDLAVETGNRQRDLLVLAVDGGGGGVVASSPYEDRMVGWSHGGRRLLFFSDRLGTSRLWSVAVANAKAEGPPELIQPPVPWSPGAMMSSSGTLFYGTVEDVSRAQIASFDFASGQFLSTPVDLAISGHPPVWSPDGKAVAYVSSGITIRSLDTGRVRQLRPALVYFSELRWSPDGRALAVNGTDANGRKGIYGIDTGTGDVSPLVPTIDLGAEPSVVGWSQTGKSIFFSRAWSSGTDKAVAVFERDLSSGAEREVIRRAGLGSASLSPDGQYVGAVFTNQADGSHGVVLVRTAGSEERILLVDKSATSLAMWSPDSRAFFVMKRTADGNQELWRLPLDGGQPRKTDVALKTVGAFSVHPDGRQIGLVAGIRKATQIWKVENVFPAAGAKPQAAGRKQ
jgi:Tol biopolymer transport system component